MAITADFHLHSNFSGDSQAPMEEMIQQAIRQGLSHICFTEHQDIDFVYPEELTPGCFEINTDAYLYDLLKLKAKYQDHIRVMFGIELGLQPHLRKEIAVYSKSHDFDFMIGSVHLCNKQDPYFPAFYENKTEHAAHMEYFKCVKECLQKLPFFDVCGHLDYSLRYAPTKATNFSYDKYEDVLDSIFTCLIEAERGIELNTTGFSLFEDSANPWPVLLKRYRELGGEIITIGSDAHTVDKVGQHFDKACDVLKAAGFKYYAIFEGRTPEFFRV